MSSSCSSRPRVRERVAISSMLTTLTARAAKLTPHQQEPDEVTESLRGGDQADQVTTRIAALDERAREIETIDRRIQDLKEAAGQAEQTTQQAIGPEGELHKHRAAIQQVSSQAVETQAALEALKAECAILEELRRQLRASENEVRQATSQAGALKNDLDQIRSTAASLTEDYTGIRETSREAREDSTAAIALVQEVERKLVPLATLNELTGHRRAPDRIECACRARHAETKSLEQQQQAVEHAVVEAKRVNEMVWSMDVQIGKLSEG